MWSPSTASSLHWTSVVSIGADSLDALCACAQDLGRGGDGGYCGGFGERQHGPPVLPETFSTHI